ncbi:MAG: glycosyltransferase family 2 protein [Planctomycetota bacterium]
MDLAAILACYALLLLLSVHGLHRALLVVRLLRHRPVDGGVGRAGPRPAPPPAAELPVVTVQLPLYDELYVVDRLLEAAAALRWPREKLEIQVLDDSQDETVEAVRRKVAELRARGFDARQVRRRTREGFKAGALAFGLAGGDGEPPARGRFVAIFDADFVPRPDFLERTVPVLMADDGLALVQARWDHLNRDHSLLTRVQAVFLDAHFAVEHEARQRAGRFLNFNGTAGVWRREAIERAGGWSHDTLTEDLDLSFRAQMAGMRFHYLNDLGVPSELPVEMNAFKGQQHRWAKGAIETSLKLLPTLLRRRDLPLGVRLEGAFHLTCNLAYPLMGLVSLLALPVALAVERGATEVPAALDGYLLGLGILPVLVFFLVGQLRVGRRLLPSLLLLPASLAIGVGLCVNNTRAVLEAAAGRRSPFVRTPKYRVDARGDTWLGKKYRAARDLAPLLELALGLGSGAASWLCLRNGILGLGLLDALFASGYLYVGLHSTMPAAMERLRHRLDRLLPARLGGARPVSP